jgi:hypothetical protein
MTHSAYLASFPLAIDKEVEAPVFGNRVDPFLEEG